MSAKEPLFTRPFLLAGSAHLLHSLAFYLYLSVPGFLAELGASEPQIGAIFGVTAASAILLRPPLGKVMDTRGRRVVALTGGVLSTLVCAAYLTVHALGPWVVVVRIAHGLSEAMLFASLFAIAADLVPASRRIEGIAWFGVTGLMPMALSGPLAELFLASGGYRALFLASVAFSAVALLLTLPIRDVPPPVSETRPRGVLAALAQPDLRPLWLLGVVFAAVLAAPFTYIKTFVMTTHIGSFGHFVSAYGAAATVTRIGFGTLPERAGPKRVLVPALAAQAGGMVLLALATSPGFLVGAGLLAGVGHGFVFPILLGLVVTRARAEERGAALSIFTALFDCGTLIGAPTLGFVIHAAGYPAMFAVAAATVTAGAIAFVAWDRARALRDLGRSPPGAPVRVGRGRFFASFA